MKFKEDDRVTWAWQARSEPKFGIVVNVVPPRTEPIEAFLQIHDDGVKPHRAEFNLTGLRNEESYLVERVYPDSDGRPLPQKIRRFYWPVVSALTLVTP